MKNLKSILIMTAAAIFMFCSCQKIEEPHKVSNKMRFIAEYPCESRVTETAFEAGDIIGVWVSQYDGENPLPLQLAGNYANNVKTTFDGTNWNTTFPIYWIDNVKFDVFAYYPYGKPNSVDDYVFSVALDQSSAKSAEALGGYEASDFLWAKTEGIMKTPEQTAQEVPVSLVFKHRMSKLRVNILKGTDYEGELPNDMTVRVHNTVTDATIDLSSGIVTKNNRKPQHSVTAHKVSDNLYEAIIVPQRVDSKLPFIEIITQGVSYLIEDRFVFRQGIVHIYDVILNGNPNQVKIEIGGEIESEWQ